MLTKVLCSVGILVWSPGRQFPRDPSTARVTHIGCQFFLGSRVLPPFIQGKTPHYYYRTS